MLCVVKHGNHGNLTVSHLKSFPCLITSFSAQGCTHVFCDRLQSSSIILHPYANLLLLLCFDVQSLGYTSISLSVFEGLR